jgi:hypothetical protein
MSLLPWLTSLFPQRSCSQRTRRGRDARSRKRPVRLAVTLLEDRLAPAVLTVNTLADAPLSGVSSTLSLREAIALIDSGGAATDAAGYNLSAAKASQIDTTSPFGTNDTIQFTASLADQSPITLSLGELLLSANVAILAPTGSQLVVSGSRGSGVFDIASGTSVSIAGLTITAGNASNGGGILNSGTLTFIDSTVAGNSAGNGGGIFNSGTLTLIDSTVSDNSASDGGGILNLGTMAVVGSTVSDNSASNDAGVLNGGALTLTGSTVSDNVAQLNNGGIVNVGTLTLTNSTVSGNSASVGNGGIANYGGTLTLSDSIVSGNSASAAGGLGNYGGSSTLNHSAISGNSAIWGGGVVNLAALTLIDSTVSDNSAVDGAGIATTGTLTLRGSTVSGDAASNGADLFNDGTLTLQDSTVTGNTARQNGAGSIQNLGSISARNSVLVGSSATDLASTGTFDNLGGNRMPSADGRALLFILGLRGDTGGVTLVTAPQSGNAPFRILPSTWTVTSRGAEAVTPKFTDPLSADATIPVDKILSALDTLSAAPVSLGTPASRAACPSSLLFVQFDLVNNALTTDPAPNDTANTALHETA